MIKALASSLAIFITFTFFSQVVNTSNQKENEDSLKILNASMDSASLINPRLGNSQREFYAAGVYIDTTEEKGSFDNPYIVDKYLDADPYVWFYQENYNRHLRYGKGMYGLNEDMIAYAEELIKEIGKGLYDYDRRENGSMIEWEVIEENGAHYTITVEIGQEVAQLYLDELSQEEHLEVLKKFKKLYIKEYGKELVNKWLDEE